MCVRDGSEDVREKNALHFRYCLLHEPHFTLPCLPPSFHSVRFLSVHLPISGSTTMILSTTQGDMFTRDKMCNEKVSVSVTDGDKIKRVSWKWQRRAERICIRV